MTPGRAMTPGRTMTPAAWSCSAAHGFSLASMLVGLSLGLIASLAGFAIFRVASGAYGDIVDNVMLEERGHRALAILSYAVRHAGWAPPAERPTDGSAAPLIGYDDCARPATDDSACQRAGYQGSDALRIRMIGSSRADEPAVADGTMTDCGGFGLPMRALDATERTTTALNLFYIGRATDGMPQLMCRYPRRRGGRMDAFQYTGGALVRGVETMQLRYGVDDDGDGLVEAFVRADALHARGAHAWHHVRAVQIAIVMRGERRFWLRTLDDVPLALLHPTHGDPAPDDVFAPQTDPERRRRVFTATVRLRNPSGCAEGRC